MDILSPSQRSVRMSLIRSKDTKPELVVRRLIHSMGYRYRLHSRVLPGKPDLVFASRKKIIFVNGCLWHGHEGCRYNRPPKARPDYWKPKLERNRQRDISHYTKLRELGWQILVIWECETKTAQNLDALSRQIVDFLGPIGPSRLTDPKLDQEQTA